ncbi:hypothetical protein [Pleomorphomonas sp. NRK KF1]|uniref:hypothetical protein n=1 Tax=Pleomorphomonas sp. NRK KF1 TaxID=2943000 RepID=UPI002043E84E|nr:hypothetical protein [Pleomorphomonas sp. NRK KF1]MCM5555995.1 hypothetical protein [Pleomorphomonas sp. NRK KF1]
MRFLAGLRFVVAVAALLGLLAGQSAAIPAGVGHVAMMAATSFAHECCETTSGKPIEKTNLAGDCAGIGCFMAAPALLPIEPALAFVADRASEKPLLAIGLTGRTPPPLLEPPRA